MSFRDYLESKVIALCMGGIGLLYLTLIVWLCGLPLSLLLIFAFSGVFMLLICMVLSWRRTDRRLRMLKRKLDYPDKFEEYINRLSAYMETSGKHYANHYATIRKRLDEDSKPKPGNSYDYDYTYDKGECL